MPLLSNRWAWIISFHSKFLMTATYFVSKGLLWHGDRRRRLDGPTKTLWRQCWLSPYVAGVQKGTNDHEEILPLRKKCHLGYTLLSRRRSDLALAFQFKIFRGLVILKYKAHKSKHKMEFLLKNNSSWKKSYTLFRVTSEKICSSSTSSSGILIEKTDYVV